VCTGEPDLGVSAVEAGAGQLDSVRLDGAEDGVARAFCREPVGLADRVDQVAAGDGASNGGGAGSGDSDAPQGAVVVLDDEDAVGIEPPKAPVFLKVASAATEALSLGHHLESILLVTFTGSGGFGDFVATKE